MRGVISSALCLPNLLRVTDCDITIICNTQTLTKLIVLYVYYRYKIA